MNFEGPQFEIPNKNQESKEKEQQLVEKIAEYQRDRTNEQAREAALAGIRERTLILPREEYEKYVDKNYDYLTEEEQHLRKQMYGFSHTPDTRAVLNKDAIDERFLSYIRTHEETENLEEGPFPEEKRKWEDEHGGEKHPQENINSHIEATYAEYRHAKEEGFLDAHHAYIVNDIRRVMEGDASLREMIEYEEEQRNRIYEEVKNEEQTQESPIHEILENNPELAKIFNERSKTHELVLDESGKIVSDGQIYDNNQKMRALIELANAIRDELPPVQEGHVRLWRGNRPEEIGYNPSYTNSLEGIALPFLRGYNGVLSYIDVSQEEAKKYLLPSGSAKDSEFKLPPDVAKSVHIVGYSPEEAEDIKKKSKPLSDSENVQGDGWTNI